MYYFFERIIIIDKNARRQDANTAIVYLGSLQQKRQAEVNMRKELGKMRARGVMIRDLFPLERMEEVRTLNKKGFEMKTNSEVQRFRIINRREMLILQVLYNNAKGYKDVNPHNVEDAEKGQNREGPLRGAEGGQASGEAEMERGEAASPPPPAYCRE